MRRTAYVCLLALLLGAAAPLAEQKKTENVILITLDGARTQEIFGGLDLAVLKSVTRKGRVEDSPLYKKYWAPTPEERRQKVMPFFWGVLMKQHGSIAGNRALGSTVQITNTHRFSYPGYSEILTGQAHDDVINSNDKRRNPYPTVLEFLKRKLKLDARQVAAFASWDTINYIVEHEPGTITSNAGYQPYGDPDPILRELSRFQLETPIGSDARHDAYTFRFAKSHLERHKPRVLYISMDETDEWAHQGLYEWVIQALARSDRYLRELWEHLQAQTQYRNKTTILITADHGRGNTPEDWRDHGAKVEGAQYIWLAVISPDSPLRGEWSQTETVYQNQIAATLCRFLGLDYAENNPQAGKPIARLFP